MDSFRFVSRLLVVLFLLIAGFVFDYSRTFDIGTKDEIGEAVSCTDKNLNDRFVYIQKNGCELKNKSGGVIIVLNKCSEVTFDMQVSNKRSQVTLGIYQVGRVDNDCLPPYLIR